MEVVEFQYVVILIRHFYCLCSIYLNTVVFMIVQDSFRAETLETVHAEVFSFLVFCLVEHECIEIFD